LENNKFFTIKAQFETELSLSPQDIQDKQGSIPKALEAKLLELMTDSGVPAGDISVLEIDEDIE
jgi:hypothetical protein